MLDAEAEFYDVNRRSMESPYTLYRHVCFRIRVGELGRPDLVLILLHLRRPQQRLERIDPSRYSHRRGALPHCCPSFRIPQRSSPSRRRGSISNPILGGGAKGMESAHSKREPGGNVQGLSLALC